MDRSGPTCIFIAGVTGSGKTTVAQVVAERLGWSVLDADGLHSAASIRKMAGGIPLTDRDRWPWLQRIADYVNGRPDHFVVACSALRRQYRQFLEERIPGSVFCLLEISPEVAAYRLAHRRAHFMPASLVASQFSTLEPLSREEPGFSVDGEQEVTRLVADVMRRLGVPGRKDDQMRAKGRQP